MGPVLLPNGLMLCDGKSGLAFLLHANSLGGVGGQARVLSICTSFGGAAAIGSQMFLPCTDGWREVLVGPGNHVTLGWQAPGQVVGSPVVGGNTVYSLSPSNGTLYALDSQNGTITTSLQVGQASRFATPTLYGGHVFVWTFSGVVSVSTS